MFRIEKITNFIVGLILLNNLYLISGILGIPNNFIIVLCFVISLFYFILNFNKDIFVNLLNNWNTIFYLTFSILFCIIDWLINNSKPNFNDIIRVLIYSLYFTWTFIIYNDALALKKWLVKICFYSIIILTIEGLIESLLPEFFYLLLSTGNIAKKQLSRIGGTLIDANCYSGIFCLYLVVLYYEWDRKGNIFKEIVFFLLVIITIYITELSGSRQTLLMLVVFLFYLFLKNFSVKKFIYLIVFLVVSFCSLLIFSNQIETYLDKNQSSSVARFVSGNNSSQSTKSNEERKNSILAGATLMVDNNFIFGPGIINFTSRWENYTQNEIPFPHNGFVFIFTQFGIYALIPIFIMYLVAKRSYNEKIFLFYVLLVIHYSLVPNLMYYCTTYFALFYIDSKYLHHTKLINK